MLDLLQKILHDHTRRNIIINTIGNYLNVFFTALFALILVRIMSPSQYGVLSVLLGIAYVLANVLDFGTTATIYSYVPDMYAEKDSRLYQFIKSTFFFQSLFSMIVIVTLFFTFPYLDQVFFKTHVEPYVLHLTTFSVLLFIWQNFFTNILFAAKKFMKANIYNNAANVVKTALILLLAYTGYISVGIIIFVFGVVGPMVFFIFLLFSHHAKLPELHRAEIKKEEFRFSYTLTYFLSSQFYNLGLRMDLFLMSYFGLKAELGYYGLAQKIILTIITSIISITQVLSPRFATIHAKHEVKKQLITATYYLLLPTGIFISLYFTPKFVFQLVFTENFAETYAATRALALPFILNAIGSAPLLFLLYTIKKPSYILVSNLLFFLIITVGSYYLIPTKGMFGPPIAIFWAFILATLIQVVAAYREYQKLPA